MHFPFGQKMMAVKQGGFGLIAVAIVLVLVGYAVTASVSMLKVEQTQSYITDTRSRLSFIEQGLKHYVLQNGHLPCVADPELSRQDPGYGLATDCHAPAVGTTIRVTNPDRDNRAVRIGTVPVRTLNIPDKYMRDKDGQFFTYAVTEIQVTGALDNNLGAVEVVNENGISIFPPEYPEGAGIYALVAHGSGGKGAIWTPSCSSTVGLDQENCDDDYTFSLAPFSTADGAMHYDDFILYSANFIPNCGVQGEVFDGEKCIKTADSFGGSYSWWMGGGAEQPSCRTPNVVTGDCTCPSTYRAVGIYEWNVPSCTSGFFSDGWRTTNCKVRFYMCMSD